MQVRPVIDALMVKMRRQMLSLLAEAYSLVSAAKLASLLGVSEAEAASITQAEGWQADAPSGMFITKQRQEPQPDLNGQAKLAQLTNFMVHIES